MDEILELVTDKETRVHYLEHDFLLFYEYHFEYSLEEFQVKWAESLQSHQNTMIVSFRDANKTTLTKAYILWCICYCKEPYIIIQSYNSADSAQWVRSVASMLFKPSILEDYGELFPVWLKKSDIKKSWGNDFETRNGVKIVSKSLGENVRWANSFDLQSDKVSRPTLLVLDDIDVEASIKNKDVINKNENKIINETIGAMDSWRRKIIFLWNVIEEDWVVPRFEKRYSWKSSWNVFRQPLFEDWKNIWSERFTEKVIQDLRDMGETFFQQNYLLIPFSNSSTIIKRDDILFYKELPSCVYYFWVDPAFSEKTNTDEMALTIIWVDKDDNVYIINSIWYKWHQKDEDNFTKEAVKFYEKYSPRTIFVEGNNGGEIIARMLRKKWMPVKVLTSSKDKVTRLREHEFRFNQKKVFFGEWTQWLQEQLLNFPSKMHDDRVDSMVNAMNWVRARKSFITVTL